METGFLINEGHDHTNEHVFARVHAAFTLAAGPDFAYLSHMLMCFSGSEMVHLHSANKCIMDIFMLMNMHHGPSISLVFINVSTCF